MVNIRIASLDDNDELALLFHRYRALSISLETIKTLNDSKQWICSRMKAGDAVYWVAEQQDKLVGFATLYRGFSSVGLALYWILNDLYVDESCRGQGVSRQLMQAIHQYALQTQVKGIELETAKTNRVAQRLYESLGYQQDLHYQRYFWSAL